MTTVLLKRAFEYRHVVGFEETNLVGNVYYVNHIRWQGRAREMFLRECAPEVLEELKSGLSLATLRCSCDYLAELNAFDEILIRMRLLETVQNRIALTFEYWRPKPEPGQLVARGEQEIACLRREHGRLLPTPIPASLREALRPYQV